MYLAPSSTGTIEAVGEAQSMIIFTSMHDDEHGITYPGSTGNPAKGDWLYVVSNGDRGFKKDEIRNCRFEFCKFMYAGTGLNINFLSSEPVQHNHFIECEKGIGIRASTNDKGPVTVFNNLITDCDDGVSVSESEELTVYIESNTIDNCAGHGISVGAAIDWAYVKSCLISRCEDGILGTLMFVSVRNCGFYSNTNNGLIDKYYVLLSENPFEEGYYLYQDCALIDAGSDPGNNGMPGFTTSVLETEDVPPLDIGYHYPQPVPTIWYVDCNVQRSGDGTSWNEAFKTLLEALWKYGDGEPGPWSPPENPDIQAGDEIWVANGVYNLTETVAVYDDVSVYGGFRGKEGSYPGETERDERDWEANLTIINGGYDIYDIYAGCRCLHVYADCTIDGLIIAHGRSRGHVGGGMFIVGNPKILNCGFLENAAISVENARGGAIYKSSGSPLIKNCWFSRNDNISISPGSGTGGAIYNYGGSPDIINCLIVGNKSKADAGIFNWGSDAVVVNCGFFGNTCTEIYTHFAGPAGITNRNRDAITSDATMLNCTFSRNFTHNYAATDVYCDGDQSSVVSNCVFWGSFTGEELYDFGAEAYGGGSSVIKYCRVNIIDAPYAWFDRTYEYTLIEEDPEFNGIISTGSWTSDAVYNGTLYQTTLTDLYASWIPGQLEGKIIDLHTGYTTSGSGRDTEFKANTHYIVASNTDTTVNVWGNATRAMDFTYYYDPEWIIWYDIGQAGHEYWIYDYNLQSDSPCVDTGDPATSEDDVGDKDLAGNPRFVDIIDMGAYERQD